MLDILGRLYRIARSRLPRGGDGFEKFVSGDDPGFHDDPREDARFSMGDEDDEAGGFGFQDDANVQKDFETPDQVRRDLAEFGLTPPSSLREVRAARNREIKKYHPDRYMNDPDKLETSKEIMQIFNAAYDRLKTYYENH